jgi:DnaJ domain
MTSWGRSPHRLFRRALVIRNDIPPRSSPCIRAIHATIPRSASASTSDDIRWPTVSNPSPYEILDLPQTASASEIKARYYILAKRYHPDSHELTGETTHERLHRFRQVVQAHEFLSTTRHRRIYDSHGYGWGDMRFNDIMSDPIHWKGNWEGRFRAAGSPPRQPDVRDTWEDFKWKPWQTAKPYYTSNANFAGAVIVFVVLFGVMEFGHVQASAKRAIEARELVHERASANLRDARNNAKSRRDMIEEMQQRRYVVSNADLEGRVQENIKR